MAAMEILSHSVRDPMTKIALGKQYNHTPWLREGFTILCVRPAPLSVVEASQLTKEDIIACAAAREGIRGLKGIRPPLEGSSSAYRDYEKLFTSEISCRSECQTVDEPILDQNVRNIVESFFLFPKEGVSAEEEEFKSTQSQLEAKTTTSGGAPKLQFIPNVIASVKELPFSQRLLQRCKGSWEPRLSSLAGSESRNLTGKLAVKEYLAGLSCLLLLTMGILVITW